VTEIIAPTESKSQLKKQLFRYAELRGLLGLPMPVSLSQISLRGTAPRDPISSHIPASKSPVIRDGIIRA
jgi:hypothetical protein